MGRAALVSSGGEADHTGGESSETLRHTRIGAGQMSCQSPQTSGNDKRLATRNEVLDPATNNKNDSWYQKLRPWLLWLLFWTVISISYGLQRYSNMADDGYQNLRWWQPILWSLEDWYLWGLFTIPIVQFAKRYPFDGQQTAAKFVIHMAASMLTVPAYMWIRMAVSGFQFWEGGQPVSYCMIYWEIIAVYHLYVYHRRSYQREVEAAELEQRLAEARLETLRMQLQPHFLFNTLNSISSLMQKDVDAADRMISQLSDVLRASLDSSREQVVPLRREIDFLESYLAIEKTRFGDRLVVEWDIAPDSKDILVPNLILQPLVENSVRHGLDRSAKTGLIRIESRHEDDRLVLVVRDNGTGDANTKGESHGIGLSNTRSRLSQIYAEDYELNFGPLKEQGFQVEIRVPWRTQWSRPRLQLSRKS